MKLNYKQEEKYRYKLKDLCEKYANHKVTFGIVFEFIKKRRIIENGRTNEYTSR